MKLRTPRRPSASIGLASIGRVSIVSMAALLVAGCGQGVDGAADASQVTGSTIADTTTTATVADTDAASERVVGGVDVGEVVTLPRPVVPVPETISPSTIINVRPTLRAPAPEPDPQPEPEPDPEPDPVGDLLTIDDLRYAGAFRLPSGDFGDSNVDYAVGTLAYNPVRHSLFVAGHAHHNAIAEFAIPSALGSGDSLGDLPIADTPLQPFVSILEAGPNGNPDQVDRITGLHTEDGQLLVNTNRWYDAAGGARDTTLVVRDASNLGGAIDGYFELDGAALTAGYLSAVPTEWQGRIGGSLVSGWASNYSIISRYSVGPSLYGLDPKGLLSAPAGSEGPVATTEHMSFPHRNGTYLDPEALLLQQGRAPASWNFLSRAVYGFIVPGTRTFAVVGSNGGIDSGIGYKITQDDGNLCGGHCSYAAGDNYNYYWMFDLDEILAADAPHTPRPYAQGRWSIPFDDGADHLIIGATFDEADRTLYLALADAGQVGAYDRPPLIVAYNL